MSTSHRSPAPKLQPQLPTEVEFKLAVEDRSVFDEILALPKLARYRLRQMPRRSLRDWYWDTPAGDLGRRRISLRLRLQDGEPLLTLKGPTTMQSGLFSRDELELPATWDGWVQIRGELAQAGLMQPLKSGAVLPPKRGWTPDGRSAIEPGSHLETAEWLCAAGLALTQDRTTERRPLIAEQAGRAVVELALDTVTYQLGRYEVVFREIEAETLTGETEPVLAIGAALRRAFGERVSPSEHGKYARGRELAVRLTGL